MTAGLGVPCRPVPGQSSVMGVGLAWVGPRCTTDRQHDNQNGGDLGAPHKLSLPL
jgi:hypothetical protein